MRFRTEYEVRSLMTELDPHKKAVLLGSCFSDNIGQRMRQSLWNVVVNPCGILFNPHTISATIMLALGQRPDSTFFDRDGVWYSWDFSSAFAGTDREDCVKRGKEAVYRLKEALSEAGVLIVTFGTAIVYNLSSDPDKVVANCHKFPSGMFQRHRLGVDDIVGMWNQTIALLRVVNPELKIIFTVSPVRHIREGFEANSRSKAVLLLATERICESNAGCYYFPAFEILNDDLRDYRFYNSDLVHPSEESVEYLWDKFRTSFLSQSSLKLLEEGESLYRRTAHRPLVSGTVAGECFKKETETLVSEFLKRNPDMTDPYKL